MNVRWLTAVGVAVALMSAGAAAQDAKKIEEGQKLYGTLKCSMCHAVAGKGNAKGPLDGVGDKLSAEELRQWLINPAEMSGKTNSTRKPPMPTYAKQSKENIDALVAYMQSLKKK